MKSSRQSACSLLAMVSIAAAFCSLQWSVDAFTPTTNNCRPRGSLSQNIGQTRGLPLAASKSKDEIYEGPQPKKPDAFQFDLTGGRPGTIIESEAELEEKEQILQEVEINNESKTGRKKYPKWLKDDYGFLQEDEDAEYDNDDPDAIDGQ